MAFESDTGGVGVRGIVSAVAAADAHHIGNLGHEDTVVAARVYLLDDIELLETAAEIGCLSVLELLATAFADDLHVDTTLVELDKLVAGEVGDIALKHELVFRDDHDARVGYELGNGVAFLVLLVTIGLIVVAAGENGYGCQTYQ